MTRWQYFTVQGSSRDPLDPATAKYGRKDLDGVKYNCQMLVVTGEWEKSERLMRYFLRGSNDDTLTDITEPQAAALIAESVNIGRFQHPGEPVARE